MPAKLSLRNVAKEITKSAIRKSENQKITKSEDHKLTKLTALIRRNATYVITELNHEFSRGGANEPPSHMNPKSTIYVCACAANGYAYGGVAI